MPTKTKLRELAQLGFSISGQSCSPGFDLNRIVNTTCKLPCELDSSLQSLLEETWPSDLYLGAVQFFGADRFNTEHDELYPGVAVIPHGFFCFGSDGAGSLYAYCVSDKRVYLLPHENFSDAGMVSTEWKDIETNTENIKSVAVQSWGSMDGFLEWAFVQLQDHQRQQELHETGEVPGAGSALLEHVEPELGVVQEEQFDSGPLNRLPTKTGLPVDDVEISFIHWVEKLTGKKCNPYMESGTEFWLVEFKDAHVSKICFIAPGKNACRSLEIKGDWLLRIREPKPFKLIPHVEELMNIALSRPREVLPGQFLFQFRSTELRFPPSLDE